MASAARQSTGNSLLRVSQACETLLAGFNSGQAAAVKSCCVSREHAVSVSEHSAEAGFGDKARGTSSTPIELLLPLEDAMVHRRARPSLLLPAWRAIGFALGTGTAALLPPEQSAKVGASIARAVTEQYDANIRSLYDARIAEEEIEVKELFKAQRDKPSRADFVPGIDASTGGGAPTADADTDANGAPSLVVMGTLKSALRMACTVTSKV